MSDRRVIKLLVAPVGADGAPVFRLAHHDVGRIVVTPVVAWALCTYGTGDEAEDVLEPVVHDGAQGAMRVARTHLALLDGEPLDVVLAPGDEPLDVEWTELANGTRVGHIETRRASAGPWSERAFDTSSGASKGRGDEAGRNRANALVTPTPRALVSRPSDVERKGSASTAPAPPGPTVQGAFVSKGSRFRVEKAAAKKRTVSGRASDREG
ncbi:MAG: hypothetical protein ACRENE_25830 [Polyangiaceae bacterium]